METVTFSSQFIEIFDHLCQKFGVVIDWSAQNVIPYITALCGRMTSYVIFKNVVLIFAFAGILLLLITKDPVLASAKNMVLKKVKK